MTKPTWITRWPWWAWAVTATVVIAALAVALLAARGDDSTTVAGDRPTTTSTTEPTTTTSTTTGPSPTVSTTTLPTTTVLPTTAAPPPPPATTAPPVPKPAAAVITAHEGGGSGEVVVQWEPVPGATGYRVLRRIGPHPYEVTAELDVTTGASEYADGVSIWFSGTYYECVDVGDPGQRCFKVVAFNASGDARPSNIACGSPP